MSRRGEQPTVPPARFESYYNRPVLKPPRWKVPDVPGYLYLGGMAGASALMAAFGEATGRPDLARTGRLAAGGAISLGVVALVHDLGRPERFLNMLRVFKPTSPLSVGSWLVAPFGTLAGAAAAGELTGRLPRAVRWAGVGAALLGAPVATYTGALLANTAVPAWHEGYRQLPFLFAGSSLASAGAVGMAGTPVAQAGPARRMAVAGAALELASAAVLERRLGLVAEPYRTGRGGGLLRAAAVLTGAGAAGTLLGGRRRGTALLSAAALTAGALASRFGVVEAGMASARDPKYTVLPQRQRLAERQGRPAGAADARAGQPAG